MMINQHIKVGLAYLWEDLRGNIKSKMAMLCVLSHDMNTSHNKSATVNGLASMAKKIEKTAYIHQY